MKLSKAFNESKLESTKVEKVINPPKPHIFIIKDDNVFQSLLIDEDVPIKNPIIIPKTSWADIVGDDDDDFYMKF